MKQQKTIKFNVSGKLRFSLNLLMNLFWQHLFSEIPADANKEIKYFANIGANFIKCDKPLKKIE